MRQAHIKKMVATIACLTMILPYSAFAGESQSVELDPTGGVMATRPFIPDDGKNTPDQTPLSGVVPPVQNPGSDLWGNSSPLSLGDKQPGEIPEILTEEESAGVIERMNELIKMALDTMRTQRDSLSEKSGKAYDALNAEIQKYEEANDALKVFFESNEKSDDTSKDGGETIAYEVLRHVSDILGRELEQTQGAESSSLTPSANLIQQCVRYIVVSVQRIRERMTEDTSLLEAKTFSEEESPKVIREELGVQRGERSLLSREVDPTASKNYTVLGSVVLNREMAKIYELLNPPQKLHPFLRWLLYGRHLTQVRAARYLAARAKVKEICMRAKAGEGLIRYKGKIMGMFLPLPGDENGGVFELVRRM